MSKGASVRKTSIAKISRPNARGSIPRNRLFRLLDGARKQPILWVTGPAGSGKTSLIAGYLDARKLPCLWYQADERDSDIAAFFYYLGLAAKKAAPRYRKPLPLLTPEYLSGIPTFTQRFFENLYKRLRPPFAVVFDNYQDVPEESLFHGVMQNGLALVPEGIQVIILSRNEPPAAFSRLRANNAIRVVGWEDLRFTLEETKQFVRRNAKLTENAIAELHTKTEGWAAGLVLLLKGAEAEKPEKPSSGDHLQPEVFDYFAGEVFDKLDSETRGLLLTTAFLPTITARVAEHMSELVHAGGILDELNRNSFFTGRISGSVTAYRYHPLFSAFLQARAAATMTTEHIARLRIKAADLLLNEGQLEDAVELLCAAQDWNGFIRLILGNAQQLIAQGRSGTLQKWIERVPREMLDSIPWLLFWRAVCQGPFSPLESRKVLEAAFELFKKEGNLQGLILVCLAILDSYAIAFSDFSDVDRWINELEDIVKQAGCFPSPELEIRTTFALFTILYMGRPDHPRFSYWFERARSLMRSCRDNSQRVINATFLLHYYSWTGFPADTPSLMNDLHLAMKAPEVPPVVRIMGLVMKAIHGWSTASYEAGRKAVAEALETARYHGIHHYESKLYAQDVYLTTIAGDCEASSQALRKLAATTNFDNPLDASHYHLLASFDARCRDDFAASLEHARISQKTVVEGGAPFPLAWGLYNLSQALFEIGNIAEARDPLEKSIQIALMMKSVMLEFSCLLLKALLAFSEKSDESERAGLELLGRALALGKAHAIMNIGGWRRKTLARLCAGALDAGIEREFARQLIIAHRLVPDDPAAVSETWPWPLRIITLGGFDLLKDGKRAGSGRKVQHKPLLLLKALIAFGGSEVPEEKISDLLWPDSEGDAAHSAFSTTLQRLRALVGNDEALLLNERRLSLDPRFCSVDAWSFERMHERAEALWRGVHARSGREREGDAYRHGEKALELYQGYFLPGDIGEAWTAAYRERLRSKYLRLVLQQGLHLEESAQWRKAAETFQRGLETDELAEEFYQRLMICYQRTGQKAEAIRVYENCRTVLSSTLGIAPSKQTEELYSSLLK
jgi:ATP/maltotriose-dependent transcriptional regulator MalT/DNA-binding SARP family transcriptional activator